MQRQVLSIELAWHTLKPVAVTCHAKHARTCQQDGMPFAMRSRVCAVQTGRCCCCAKTAVIEEVLNVMVVVEDSMSRWSGEGGVSKGG